MACLNQVPEYASMLRQFFNSNLSTKLFAEVGIDLPLVRLLKLVRGLLLRSDKADIFCKAGYHLLKKCLRRGIIFWTFG